MEQIWNTFCDDISKNKGVKELTFEKNIVSSFLQALGWSRYYSNLEEQSGVYGRKWIPDFVFYLNKDTSAKEIILELKKPTHKQQKRDVEQIEAYMKLTDCRFGLYFGEKMEIFFLEEKEGKRSAIKVTTIDWTKDNEAGIALIKLLKFDSYDRVNLEKFCQDHLLLNSFLKVWSTPRGKQKLYDGIAEYFNLPASMRSTLASVLKFQILETPEEEPKPVTIIEPQSINPIITINSSKPRLFSNATLPRYLGYLNSSLTKQIMKSIGITGNLSDIHDTDVLYRMYEEIKVVEKQRNMHNTHSSALSTYIKYIKAGLAFEDMVYDVQLVKEQKIISSRSHEMPVKKIKHNKPRKRNGATRAAFKFEMVGLKHGDKIVFDALNLIVTVLNDNTIEYAGNEYTLSGFCKRFLPENMQNTSGAYQGPKFFSYQGKTLWKIRLEQENNEN